MRACLKTDKAYKRISAAFTLVMVALFLKIFVQIAPWDATLRSWRGECYEIMGELYKAVADIK
jgi:hypothetical protein